MTFPVMSGVSHFDPNLKRVQAFQTWHKAVTVQTDDALHILTTNNGKLVTKSMKHYYRNIITETITNSQPPICQHRMDTLNVTIGLHHSRRHVGLLRFFFLFNPYTVAHVRYDLAAFLDVSCTIRSGVASCCLSSDTILWSLLLCLVRYQSGSHSYYDT